MKFKYFKYIFIIIGLFIVSAIILNLVNDSQVETINTCKVIKLQQQNLVSGTDGDISTKVRYLVATDKETFICETSMVNGKYNNSDIFLRLKQDSTYTFKVCGFGKSMVTDYRNIIEVQ